jgi:hypothetical protein
MQALGGPSFTNEGHHMQVKLALGALCRLHCPGPVKVSDDPGMEEVLVSNWDEYRWKGRDYIDRQGLVHHFFG